MGTIDVDVAFGGMWYAIANAEELGFALEPDEARELSRVGELIRLAAAARGLRASRRCSSTRQTLSRRAISSPTRGPEATPNEGAIADVIARVTDAASSSASCPASTASLENESRG